MGKVDVGYVSADRVDLGLAAKEAIRYRRQVLHNDPQRDRVQARRRRREHKTEETDILAQFPVAGDGVARSSKLEQVITHYPETKPEPPPLPNGCRLRLRIPILR